MLIAENITLRKINSYQKLLIGMEYRELPTVIDYLLTTEWVSFNNAANDN